jgi:hypothetical protein
MEGFQKIVLIIAIIVLIITLVFFGLVLGGSSGETWPPLVPDCPDWWIADGSGNNTTCINVKDLGTCSAQSGKKHQNMKFTSSIFTGDNGMCAKYKWADNCDVSWDGITYGVENPCNQDTTTEEDDE